MLYAFKCGITSLTQWSYGDISMTATLHIKIAVYLAIIVTLASDSGTPLKNNNI